MQVTKGDKVTFRREKRVGEARDPDGIGIVKFFPAPTVVDLLCKERNSDYRTSIDNIVEVHGNVFD